MIKSEDSDMDELPSTPPRLPPEPEFAPPASPSDRLEEGNSATLTTLPEKSRRQYEREYDVFMEWRKQKKIQSLTENDLLLYFTEKSKVFKSSSLWAQFSMLKATLAIHNNTDIGKYSRLLAFLKRQCAGYKAKSSNTFTRAEINKFLLEAPDENYLLLKVVLIIGVSGACRTDELCRMTVDDIQDAGSVLIIKIPDSEVRASRTFIVTRETDSELNPIQIYRKYAGLRPAHTDHRRFFVYYKDEKCSSQVVGIHTFGKMPCRIAKYLQLPDPTGFTGHCFRKTSASLLAAADILKRNGWKTTVTRNYRDVFMEESPQIGMGCDSTMPLILTTMGTDYNEVFIEEHTPLSTDSTMSLIPEMDIKVEKNNADKEEKEKDPAMFARTNTSKFAELPTNIRRRFGSVSEETTSKVNGQSEVAGVFLGPTEIENLKNEIVKEVRQEIRKEIRKGISKEISNMKQDIIDAIKSELSRK